MSIVALVIVFAFYITVAIMAESIIAIKSFEKTEKGAVMIIASAVSALMTAPIFYEEGIIDKGFIQFIFLITATLLCQLLITLTLDVIITITVEILMTIAEITEKKHK